MCFFFLLLSFRSGDNFGIWGSIMQKVFQVILGSRKKKCSVLMNNFVSSIIMSWVLKCFCGFKNKPQFYMLCSHLVAQFKAVFKSIVVRPTEM